jgi:hypothetical protein
MKLTKCFLCASAAALTLAFAGCKKDSKPSDTNGDTRSSGSSAAGAFSPKVNKDAEIVLGLNLDLKKLEKIGEDFFEQIIALVDDEGKTPLGEAKNLIGEAKEEYTKFVKDPFKDAPSDILRFVEAVGLRNAKVGWAVASVESIALEKGSSLPEKVPGMALAIATDVNVEKIVEHAKREMAEKGNGDFAIDEGTLAGKKTWWILPTKERDKRRFKDMQFSPCFTSLDGQLVLIASTPSMLTKQILLYLEGKDEGRLLDDFKPANGDLARLAVKDIGAILRKLPPREQRMLSMPMVKNGNELVLGFKEMTLALAAKPSRGVELSCSLRTASANDADSLRTLVKNLISMAANPDAELPKKLVDSLNRTKVAGDGDVIEIAFDDILFVGVTIPNFLKYRTESQAAACISNIKMLQVAGEHWLINHPGTTAPTLRDLCGPEDTKYLKKTPTCPKDHSAYTITIENGAINVKCGSGDPKHALPY